jgi:hypothetical protein
MLSSGVDDVLPMAQGACKICLLTGLDQVVADAGGPGVCDLLHQCVARSVMGLGEQQGTALDGNTYKAMIGVRRTIPPLAVEDSNCRMCRADSRPSVRRQRQMGVSTTDLPITGMLMSNIQQSMVLFGSQNLSSISFPFVQSVY